jgi:hypothetical protein
MSPPRGATNGWTVPAAAHMRAGRAAARQNAGKGLNLPQRGARFARQWCPACRPSSRSLKTIALL